MSQAIQTLEPTAAPPRRKGAFLRTLLRERPQAAVGVGMVLVLGLVALFAPLLAPYSPTQAFAIRQPPSASHWLGTDDGGYDMLTLIMYGLRVSLIVGIAAGTVAMVVGGTSGILAGYAGRKTDAAIMRVADFFLVVPELILMAIFAKLIGQGLGTIILVIGLLQWAGTSRIVRAQVKSVRERVYVKRSKAVGAGNARIIFRHVLPQVVPLLIATAVLAVAISIFDETFLAFLGLGDPSTISLGKLIQNADMAGAASRGEWWTVVPPGVTVTLLILGFTLFGQALEDALNPRLKVSFLSTRPWKLLKERLKGAE